MILDPNTLRTDLEKLEEIEKATIRLVTQAIYDFRDKAMDIFLTEQDKEGDIGEDITREALDLIGVSKIPIRLTGKIDYKRARYVFHPEYSVRQALFVDSKTEKEARTATLQTAQTSMRIRHIRTGRTVNEPGTLPPVLVKEDGPYLTTTIFVKYSYRRTPGEARNQLVNIIVAALPNGMLQSRYNPDATDTIWLAGRNAETRGEAFRVRLSFSLLKSKASWRVQQIQLYPTVEFNWSN